MKKRYFLCVAALALFAPLVLLAFTGPYQPMPDKRILIAHPQSGCDLNLAACTALLPMGGEIVFSIQPQPISVASSLAMTLDVDDVAPQRIEVDFSGIDMNMGPNRIALQRRDARRFDGQANLPVCISGAMTWQATVLLETEREHIVVPFRFVSGHP